MMSTPNGNLILAWLDMYTNSCQLCAASMTLWRPQYTMGNLYPQVVHKLSTGTAHCIHSEQLWMAVHDCSQNSLSCI
jgi:hypothetical protein